MSAIFGFQRLDGRPADGRVLEEMSRLLVHRGPNGSGTWREGSIGLGHRIFHTTPESTSERQPMAARRGTLVLAADARIDNREELIRSLRLRRPRRAPITDAELILRAYDMWAEECAERLLGAFAFVIRDQRRNRLFLARDHFGVKPLYYHHAPGRLFAFASEIKALFALEEVPDEIDELEVARHLMVPVEEDPAATYYRHVRRALPAHAMIVTPDRVRQRRYWELDAERELWLSSDEAYAEAVREAFVEAVRCRLRSTTPVGSMLSGGLDSSSITCVAADLLRESDRGPLHTLSAIYEDVPKSDERRYIDTVLERYDVEPHWFAADRVNPIGEVEKLMWHVDGANSAGNLYFDLHLGRLAHTEGIRVALHGYDGDTTISHGRGFLRELAREMRWWRLLSEVRPLARSRGESWISVLWTCLRAYGLGPAAEKFRLAAFARRLGRDLRAGDDRQSAPPPTWARGLDAEYLRRVKEHVPDATSPPRTEREDHRRLLDRPLLAKALGWVEAVGQATQVEIRFPFFDVRLVELCLSLPPEQKLNGGRTRYVMRQAMEGILPEEIRQRPVKTSLAPGFDHSLRAFGRQQLDAALRDTEQMLARYVDPGYARGLHERFFDGRATAVERLAYWKTLSLALWLDARTTERSLPSARSTPEVRTSDP